MDRTARALKSFKAVSEYQRTISTIIQKGYKNIHPITVTYICGAKFPLHISNETYHTRMNIEAGKRIQMLSIEPVKLDIKQICENVKEH